MGETIWVIGDKFKFLDKDGKWKHGTVVRVDRDTDTVHATMDGYPRGVTGAFRSDSSNVVKVETKKKRSKV